MSTRKQQIAFPTVAQIRKGAPKNSQGHVGPDLKDKFRVIFAPGVEAAISERFTQVYQELGGLQPTRIRAMIPFQTVWDGFSSFNETYNANIRVAQADDERYLNLRDPGNGYQYLVRNGEPYKPFTPGDVVTYKNKDGKTITLKIKVYNRLRLFLPEIEELVTFEFRSTAFYDRENITQQLGAIQAVADLLNNGVAAGVPFYMYRTERDISYIDKGEAKRTKKWVIQLKADPDWVKQAIQRMSSYALTGQGFTLALNAANNEPLEIGAPPQGVNLEEDEEDDTVFEGEARDIPPTPPTRPKTTPPTRATLPKNGNGKPQAGAAPGSPLAEFERLGKLLWPSGKWEEVQNAILNNQNPASIPVAELKKALDFVQKREKEIADLDGLLKHVEKAWPVALSFFPLAFAELEERNGILDPLLLIEATAKATKMPGFTPEQDPKAGAAMIISHYPSPEPQPA